MRQHGSGAESRTRTVYAKLESNSEPERAKVCQRVAVRARVGVVESHRARERQGEAGWQKLCGARGAPAKKFGFGRKF